MKKKKLTKPMMVSEAEPLRPHSFRSEFMLRGGQPIILLSPTVFQDTYQLVDLLKNEVGWLGVVERKGNEFLIKEIFLFDQVVDYAANIISADALIAWADKITDEREDGMEILNNLRFWGHSHGMYLTSPSRRDDIQMETFAKSCDDFFIRGIANRFGCLEFTLYLYKEGVEIHDCPWSVYVPEINSERKNNWQKEIKEKVKEANLSLSCVATQGFPVDWQSNPIYADLVQEILVEEMIAKRDKPKSHLRKTPLKKDKK